MKISILTLFPDMIKGFLNESIIKRAQEKKLVEIEIINLRDFAIDAHGTVDDRPYGGGAGMVLRVDVLAKAIKKITNEELRITNIENQRGDSGGVNNETIQQSNNRVILTSAKGKPYSQQKAQELSQLNHIVIIAAHYEGVDERAMEFIDEEISLGDFILTGGEIPTVAIVDSVVRLLPGVLKKEDATEQESFFKVSVSELLSIVGEDEIIHKLKVRGVSDVLLLEYPHYTRPAEFEGKTIPEILTSGNHEQIYNWRIQKAYEETKKKRPDLLN